MMVRHTVDFLYLSVDLCQCLLQCLIDDIPNGLFISQ